MTVSVFLGKALICFAGQCFPVLYGEATPVGKFEMVERVTVSEGYGGNVIQFKETESLVLAVHRIWLGSPAQMRLERLASETPKDNKVTDGCINVEPEVFEALIEHLDHDNNLEIVP